MISNSARILATTIAWFAISSSVVSGQDLSRYREFQLGSTLAAVARQAGIAAEPRVLHQRPELIQELMWLPPRVLGSSPEAGPVRKILFRFYDGQLFRMVISYDGDRTEGLTVDDMVEAMSATYGVAILPATGTMPTPSAVSSASDESLSRWEDSRYSLNLNYGDKILARWEGPEYTVHLFRSPYLSTFGLVLFSKRLDALARTATIEATRLDELEAPQREIARQQKQTEENRVKQETARQANRVTFRY